MAQPGKVMARKERSSCSKNSQNLRTSGKIEISPLHEARTMFVPRRMFFFFFNVGYLFSSWTPYPVCSGANCPSVSFSTSNCKLWGVGAGSSRAKNRAFTTQWSGHCFSQLVHHLLTHKEKQPGAKGLPSFLFRTSAATLLLSVPIQAQPTSRNLGSDVSKCSPRYSFPVGARTSANKFRKQGCACALCSCLPRWALIGPTA